MTEINHQSISQYIRETEKSSFSSVYLIFGEDFLYQQVVHHIVNALIPNASKQRHGHEIIRHQETGQIVDIIERLNTYAFFKEKKIIELRDSSVFITQKNQDKLIQKIKKAYDNSDFDQATRYYLELLGRLHLEPSEINEQNLTEVLNIDPVEFPDRAWLTAISEEAQKKVMSAIHGSDESELLKTAIEKGFPQNNHLIITTDIVDKRTGLYQTIKKAGVVIDCSVAKGSRKAEKDEQRQVIAQYMNRKLKRHQKEIAPDAFDVMYDKIGFDMRNFSRNLEKLISYVGDRKSIHTHDVEAIFNQVRQDPIYELTGAISEKNIQKSTHYLSSLQSSGYHPLQILMAITNQIRKLITIKEFLNSRWGAGWHRGMRFDQFQKDVLPLIKKYDDELISYVESQNYVFWEKTGADAAVDKKNYSSDLFLTKKSSHPYSLYLLITKSEIFQENHLLRSVEILSLADAALKTTGQRPKSILENMIIQICVQSD